MGGVPGVVKRNLERGAAKPPLPQLSRATWSEMIPDSSHLTCHGHSEPNTPPVSNPKTSPSITLFQTLLQV
jgi:hypothetical protein